MRFKSCSKKFIRFESVTALLNFSVVIFLSSLASFASAGGSNFLIQTVARIAAEIDAHVGFAAYDLESEQSWEYQGDQRFALSSTFKTLACAALLHRVDAGQESLERAVSFSKSDLVTYSPITETYAGAQPMTLSDLCEAALTMSDNTAANLVLRALGGPEKVTSFVRGLGDDVTRLDRWETELNEAVPDDNRDTTTPNAMVNNLQSWLLGDALSEKSRDQLRDWLNASSFMCRGSCLCSGLIYQVSGLSGTTSTVIVFLEEKFAWREITGSASQFPGMERTFQADSLSACAGKPPTAVRGLS